jgi:hypothetical protein
MGKKKTTLIVWASLKNRTVKKKPLIIWASLNAEARQTLH